MNLEIKSFTAKIQLETLETEQSNLFFLHNRMDGSISQTKSIQEEPSSPK